MQRFLVRILTGLTVLSVLAFAAKPKQRNLKPGFNLFSKEQDVQMGQEYAKQVEQQMAIVTDADINAFVQRMGQRLASAPEADKYPYSFKVVQEKSINAFALPGGPTFTHTGLISAADNEGQVAGVLAHEIAHVVLRHGTNQASKAQLLQLPTMLGAQMSGGGITGMLAQLGIGLGANSVLMRFSRNAERDADLLGARMMHSAGYNPIELARFFEKLEAEGPRMNKLAEFFMSSHPNPGNRVKTVQEEIRFFPQKNYDGESGQIEGIKRKIQSMPELPKPQPAQLKGTGDPNNPSAARPSGGFKNLSGGVVTFDYPDNWEVHQQPNSQEVTVVSKAGVIGNAIAYGAMAGFAKTQQRDLGNATREYLQGLVQNNQGMQVVAEPRGVRINGMNAAATRLQSPSAFNGQKESDFLITMLNNEGVLFYMILAAPEGEVQHAQPSFDRMINSIKFSKF